MPIASIYTNEPVLLDGHNSPKGARLPFGVYENQFALYATGLHSTFSIPQATLGSWFSISGTLKGLRVKIAGGR
jgi:hypothetical protein